MFCGSIASRKDPLSIVRALRVGNIVSEIGVFRMIGDGPLRADFEKSVRESHLEEKVEILGSKPQTEVPQYMQEADIFILPSLYDGWGAVVNEALQAGCYVIVSDACGASDLIRKDSRLGQVFIHGDHKALAACIDYANKHIQDIRSNRGWRLEWAEQHISGKVVASYMVDCLVKSTGARM